MESRRYREELEVSSASNEIAKDPGGRRDLDCSEACIRSRYSGSRVSRSVRSG